MTRASTCTPARGGLVLLLAAFCTGTLVPASPTYLTPANTPFSSPQIVTISGLSFQVTDKTPSVLFGNTHVCGMTSWSSRCVSESVPGPQYLLQKTMAVYEAVCTAVVFSFDGPVSTAGSVNLLPVGSTKDPTSDSSSALQITNIDVLKVASNSAYTVSSGAASGPGLFSLKTVPANSAFTDAGISAGVFGCSLSGSRGVSFGAADTTLTRLISSTQCRSTSWSTGTNIVCYSNSGSSAAVAATLSVTSQSASTVDVTWNAPSTTGLAGMSLPVQVYEVALSNVACSSGSVGALVAAGTAQLYSPAARAQFATQGTGACTMGSVQLGAPPPTKAAPVATKNFGPGTTAPPQASDVAVTITAQSADAAAASISALEYAAVPGLVVLRVSVPTTPAAGSAAVTVKTITFVAPASVYTIFPLGRVAGESNSRITIRGRYFGWSESKPTITLLTSTVYTCDNDDLVQSAAGLTTTVRKGWVSDSMVGAYDMNTNGNEVITVRLSNFLAQNDIFIVLAVSTPPVTQQGFTTVTVQHNFKTSLTATLAPKFEFIEAGGLRTLSYMPQSGTTLGGTLIAVRLEGVAAITQVSAMFTTAAGTQIAGTIVNTIGLEVVQVLTPAVSIGDGIGMPSSL